MEIYTIKETVETFLNKDRDMGEELSTQVKEDCKCIIDTIDNYVASVTTTNENGEPTVNMQRSDNLYGYILHLYDKLCIDHSLCVCEGCSMLVECDNTRVTESGGRVCSECIDREDYYICDSCGDAVYVNDVTWSANNTPYCENCSDELFYCDVCGSYYESCEDGQDMQVNHYGDCQWYCNSCINRGRVDIFYCDDCGRAFSEDLGGYYEEEDAWICDECYNRRGARIHPYTHKPDPEFRTSTLDSDKLKLLFTGWELEVDGDSRLSDSTQKQVIDELSYILGDLVYYKKDSSLEYGFECVSHPATLNYWIENKDKLSSAFNVLLSHNIRSHDTSTCGYHIHANRDYLGDTKAEQEETIDKIILILEGFKENVKKFSRRSNYHYCDFLSNIAKDDGYIQDTDDLRNDKVIADVKLKSRNRYTVLNLNNCDTIELRVLRGTLNIETFIAGLQFFANVIELAKTKSVRQLNGMKWQRIINYNKNYWELRAYNKKRCIDNDSLLVVNKTPKTFVKGDKVQLIGCSNMSEREKLFYIVRATGNVVSITSNGRVVVSFTGTQLRNADKLTKLQGLAPFISDSGNKNYCIETYASNLVKITKEPKNVGGEL